VFAAILASAADYIDVIHGFDSIALENNNHAANGLIGFFLGDRLAFDNEGMIVYQDPPYWGIHSFDQVADTYTGKAATATECKKGIDNGQLLRPGNSKAAQVVTSKLLPLPMEWWPFFLTHRRSPLETYSWLQRTTKSWPTTEGKEAAQLAMQWARAACTMTIPDEGSDSCVTIAAAPVFMDNHIARWARHNLASYLPKPKASPVPLAQPRGTPIDGNSTILQHAMSLAHDVIKSATDRNDREKDSAKDIPEPLLCRLLGLSGLIWEDQHLLAPIWMQLLQHTDKPSKEMVLRSFFQDLAKTVPAFRHFRNSTLFDCIVNYRFEPGPNYETCHHGISLLAVSIRSYADQEKESQDDFFFEQATNKTPDAVKKHHNKMPPPLPTMVAELMQLLWRMIALTVGLFTEQCSLVVQLKEFHTELQEREQHIMGDPTAAAELTPQLTWAIIVGAREFLAPFAHVKTLIQRATTMIPLHGPSWRLPT
jgi:hypothetical protein